MGHFLFEFNGSLGLADETGVTRFGQVKDQQVPGMKKGFRLFTIFFSGTEATRLGTEWPTSAQSAIIILLSFSLTVRVVRDCRSLFHSVLSLPTFLHFFFLSAWKLFLFVLITFFSFLFGSDPCGRPRALRLTRLLTSQQVQTTQQYHFHSAASALACLFLHLRRHLHRVPLFPAVH